MPEPTSIQLNIREPPLLSAISPMLVDVDSHPGSLLRLLDEPDEFLGPGNSELVLAVYFHMYQTLPS